MNKLHLRTPESVYLEWLNDFLTTEYMAEYYDIPLGDLQDIIEQGRNDHKKHNPA